jgi:protein TonB
MVEMRTAFAGYSSETTNSRNWAASFLASSAIYVAIAVTAITIGSARKVVRLAEKAIDVTFVEKIVKEVPPPAPMPVAPPQAPVAAAPVVRPDQKIRRLDKPPPPKVLAAPKEMPLEAPREADPSEDKGIAVYGEPGQGDPAGLEGGSGSALANIQALPDDADPPTPVRSNAVPAYPQEARASGKMGTVVLKVIILADGSVAKVEVMRGDEPFVSAALETVKTWKYEPARYKGHPIAVYRIIQIPFKLTA